MNKEVTNSIEHLKKGNILLYPTDTVWGIGCDATNENAVKKIYQIKKRDESKSLIILVDSIKMLESIINDIPKTALKFIRNASKPTSIIYNNPKGLAKNVIANDNTVAIRIVQDDFCQKLIRKLGKPIISSSANISGETTPKSFDEISSEIINNVNYIVNLRQQEIRQSPSQIIKLEDNGELNILRP
jgi:L-threonylcarbamoyladenylate synthase